MAGGTIEIERERSAPELVSATFSVYQRFPLLFLILAAGVVVPYQLIVLAVTGAGPLSLREVSGSTSLISALHVQAVREIGNGGRPTFIATFRQSLPRLPVVAVAAGISGVAIGLGSLAFAIPGLILAAIWPVVAQAAALESGSPIDALRRSFALTRGHRWHAFWLIFFAGMIAAVPGILLFFPFRHSATTAGTFIAGTAVQIVVRSFEALATGLLYFDLVARERIEPLGMKTPPMVGPEAASAAGASEPPTGHPADPENWSDHDRPAGWYIDPASPWRMHYWATSGPGIGAWGDHPTKTPRQTLAEWERLRESAENRG